jgi:quaternary ammonium compound-resistance protein SugE
MGWIYLIAAGLLEVGFTTAMRYLSWPPRPLPLAAFLVLSTGSFVMLVAATRSIPMGTAYAVWTGIGAAGTVAVGMLAYDEPATLLRVGLIALLVAIVAALRLSSP